MKSIRASLILVLILFSAAWLPAPAARAADDSAEFLHALQKYGYPDVAIEYLEVLKNDPQAPKEIRDSWDWEMSTSLRSAAKSAYGEKLAKQYLEDADAHLKKFIDENPTRPQAIRAAERAANIGEEARRAYVQAKEMTDKEKRVAEMEKVRESFQDVRKQFVKALKVNRKLLADTPPKDKRHIAERTEEVLNNQIRIAVADFYVALTFTKRSAERKRFMDKAGAAFDGIWQAHRDRSDLVFPELLAHYYTGRCRQEEGNLSDAKDFYEEVLVNDPLTPLAGAPGAARTRRSSAGSPGARVRLMDATVWDDLYAECELHYLECLLESSLKEYSDEVQEWLTSHKPLEKSMGYQAINLQLAKVCLKRSESGKAAEKKTFKTRAMRILGDVKKVGSPSQKEALQLWHQLGGEDSDVDNLEEMILRANDSAATKNWGEAGELYQKALELALKGKTTTKAAQKKLADLRNNIAVCQCNIGLDDFRKGELTNAANILEKIVKDEDSRTTPAAEQAATYLLNVLLTQWGGIDEKEDKAAKAEALKRFLDTAAQIKDSWPGKPVADAARLNIGRALLQQKKIEEAVKVFGEINPLSEHFVTALYLAGYTFWHQFNVERREAEAKAGGSWEKVPVELRGEIDAKRKRAVKMMDRAVKALADAPRSEGKLSKIALDSQLLLAEMILDQKDWKAAGALLGPLVAELQKSDDIDPVGLQVCRSAIDADLQLDQVQEAGKVGQFLLKKGPDVGSVNLALVTFARRLDAERKKLLAVAEKTSSAGEREEARRKCDAYEGQLAEMLKSLVERKDFTLASSLWVAQACATVGMEDQAVKVAKALITRIENMDPDLAKAMKADAIQARAHILKTSILRKKGKFQDALNEVTHLIEEHSRALEPKMERCSILQAWAEKDVDKYDEAARAWEGLRQRLESASTASRAKPGGKVRKTAEKPAQLYDVTYSEALCLHDWYKKAHDKKNAEKALTLLKQAELMDPKFMSPKRAERDQPLIDRYLKLENKLETILDRPLSKPVPIGVPKPAAKTEK